MFSVMNATSSILTGLLFLCAPASIAPGQQQEQPTPEIVQVPEGGRLDAVDDEGNVIGPVPLQHTDVNVDISGHFTRVELEQVYQNPYDFKIEAVYTFPMSHRAAVDRMTMIVGDRVVEGEVKEREEARRIYEAARQQGYVASLLEQQRPNIFTQSIANIEPGSEVIVRISYVEVLESSDGQYTFDFPMVVGPRYIPGEPTVSPSIVPAELTVRRGLILLGPADLEVGEAGSQTVMQERGTLQTGKLRTLLFAAQPIQRPNAEWYLDSDAGESDEEEAVEKPKQKFNSPQLWYTFEAQYSDNSKEIGQLYADGTGQLNGRWFYADPERIKDMGPGFSPDTDQVPDASNITPEPVKPGERAGHDISITVTIDTGGPAIADLSSLSHDIVLAGAHAADAAQREDDRRQSPTTWSELGSQVAFELASKSTIPNKDFVLSWNLSSDEIAEAFLTHTAADVAKGNFFTLMLNPPDRVEEDSIRPRELIFVMDTSGSMRGYPIDKSKEVLKRAIDAMRPGDTFNLVTFAGRTNVLWNQPQPNTPENRQQALDLIDQQLGSGGTEMMQAIDAALVQEKPASDGAADQPDPMRIVIFLTDGYVGNDMAIVDAIERNRGTTRVFSFGIGNSVNRYLIDGMADAGRGESEIVLLASDADEAVERLTRRIQTPVLTDIALTFDGLQVHDVLPGTERGDIPDLFDAAPLVIHGKYDQPGSGTVTVTGRTAAGPYERTIEFELPESQPQHDVIATLWAREKIDSLMSDNLAEVQRGDPPQEMRDSIVEIGTTYQIMSPYTSFVAVEKSRVTIDGQPVLVPVPIEMPDGVSYEGIFGEQGQAVHDQDGELILGLQIQPRQSQRFDSDGLAAGRILRSTAGPEPSASQAPASMPWQPTLAGRGGGSIFGDPGSAPARTRSARPKGPAGGGGGFGGGSMNSALVGDIPAALEPNPDDRQQMQQDIVESLQDDGSELAEQQPEELLEFLFGPTSQKFFVERMTITLAELAEQEQLEAATILARAVANAFVGNETANAMYAIFTADDLSNEEKVRSVQELANDNRRIIEAAIADEVRNAKLRAVLSDDLAAAVLNNADLPEYVQQRHDGIVVNVLLDEISDDRLAQLRSHDVQIIEQVTAAKFVIAAMALEQLDEVALLDGVRRIEPTRPQPADAL